ncbi:discoidin domain-containing protein [Clostridioides difficile]|nr:discoidin domain-containing protein [Clostridioides difficile]
MIKTGNQNVKDVFLGNQNINKILLGTNEIYSNMTEIKHNEKYNPFMTANNKPEPFEVNASQNTWGTYKAFTETLEDDLNLTGLSKNTSQWVQIKLDKDIKIWAIKMHFRTTISNQDTAQVPFKFKVSGSNNGVDFIEIYNCESCNPDLFCKWKDDISKYDFSDADFIEVSCNNEYQYYRIEFFNTQSISKGKVTNTEGTEVKITLLNLYQLE